MEIVLIKLYEAMHYIAQAQSNWISHFNIGMDKRYIFFNEKYIAPWLNAGIVFPHCKATVYQTLSFLTFATHFVQNHIL